VIHATICASRVDSCEDWPYQEMASEQDMDNFEEMNRTEYNGLHEIKSMYDWSSCPERRSKAKKHFSDASSELRRHKTPAPVDVGSRSRRVTNKLVFPLSTTNVPILRARNVAISMDRDTAASHASYAAWAARKPRDQEGRVGKGDEAFDDDGSVNVFANGIRDGPPSFLGRFRRGGGNGGGGGSSSNHNHQGGGRTIGSLESSHFSMPSDDWVAIEMATLRHFRCQKGDRKMGINSMVHAPWFLFPRLIRFSRVFLESVQTSDPWSNIVNIYSAPLALVQMFFVSLLDTRILNTTNEMSNHRVPLTSPPFEDIMNKTTLWTHATCFYMHLWSWLSYCTGHFITPRGYLITELRWRVSMASSTFRCVVPILDMLETMMGSIVTRDEVWWRITRKVVKLFHPEINGRDYSAIRSAGVKCKEVLHVKAVANSLVSSFEANYLAFGKGLETRTSPFHHCSRERIGRHRKGEQWTWESKGADLNWKVAQKRLVNILSSNDTFLETCKKKFQHVIKTVAMIFMLNMLDDQVNTSWFIPRRDIETMHGVDDTLFKTLFRTCVDKIMLLFMQMDDFSTSNVFDRCKVGEKTIQLHDEKMALNASCCPVNDEDTTDTSISSPTEHGTENTSSGGD
jgi:hypothetical protein